MLNAKWYLVCDIRAKTASDLIQIDNTWGSATGLLEQSDENLEHFYQWAMLHQNISFMPIQRAIEYGIKQTSIDEVLARTKPAVLAWLRQMRDPILQATDVITVADRWNSLDAVDQNYAIKFRQALRDITDNGDPFNVVWPAIPNVLDFVRRTDISAVLRPSEEFMAMLTNPYVPPSLDERRMNQCTRIKALRDKRKAGGVQINVNGADYWFQSDDPSRNQYALLASSVTRKGWPLDFTIDVGWRTMSGEYVPFTVETLYKVIDAGTFNEIVVFNVAKKHQAKVMTLDDPESYNFHEGWPLSYEDYKATLSP
jgi:hypothetical protein